MNDRPTSHKACSACGTSFPRATFNYRQREDNAWCRSCKAGYGRAYAAGGKEAGSAYIREQQRKWK